MVTYFELAFSCTFELVHVTSVSGIHAVCKCFVVNIVSSLETDSVPINVRVIQALFLIFFFVTAPGLIVYMKCMYLIRLIISSVQWFHCLNPESLYNLKLYQITECMHEKKIKGF